MNGPIDASGSTAIRSPLLQVVGVQPPRATDLLGALLREQQSLTAVERFARKHEQEREPGHEPGPGGCALPDQARYYRDLIPLGRPEAGQQYAFEVDLDVCTGCKACVAACHSLNGLEETEIWRTVGLLHGGTREAPAQQTVTTSCHHCVDPACMNGCPVNAYEKDPITGIVRHLDDQCIGCQYCTLTCPYDAPKYSKSKGIVRKCDMCSDRLSAGEAPACVQGCPNQAIRIKVIDQTTALDASLSGQFLPGAPAPDHTVPTTVYKSSRSVPVNMLPADLYSVSPQHSHPPLVIMLVLTQLAVGAFSAGSLARTLFQLPSVGPWRFAQAATALALGLLALGASVFHLGRPQYAWKAVLGLRRSWLSREALAFGLFAKAGALYALSLVPQLLPPFPGRALLLSGQRMFELAAIGFGLVGVFCSVMVYAATRRSHWRGSISGPKFFGTTALLGIATVSAISEVTFAATGTTLASSFGTTMLWLTLALAAVKLAGEATLLGHLRARRHSVLKRMAILMVRDLQLVTGSRFLCGALGGIVIPGLTLVTGPDAPGSHPVAAVISLVLLLGGELMERLLFFKAAPASRMPGGLA
jgi:Fe-S-cluster-containing dehydrogenase component/DMSO reductase anchor subunit